MGRVRAGAGALIAAVKAERKAIILWPDPRSGLLCGPHRLQQDRPVGERGALAERHLERLILARGANPQHLDADLSGPDRSEEHTSELQSLMRISYAVFCLKQKNTTTDTQHRHTTYTKCSHKQ